MTYLWKVKYWIENCTWMKAVDGRESGDLLCAVQLKWLHQLVLVVWHVSNTINWIIYSFIYIFIAAIVNSYYDTWQHGLTCKQKKTLSPYKNVFIQLLHQIILSTDKKITEKNTAKQSATRLRPFIRPTPGKSNVKLFYSNCSYNVWLNTQEIKLSIPVACTSKSFYLIPFRRTSNFASKIFLS